MIERIVYARLCWWCPIHSHFHIKPKYICLYIFTINSLFFFLYAKNKPIFFFINLTSNAQSNKIVYIFDHKYYNDFPSFYMQFKFIGNCKLINLIMCVCAPCTIYSSNNHLCESSLTLFLNAYIYKYPSNPTACAIILLNIFPAFSIKYFQNFPPCK